MTEKELHDLAEQQQTKADRQRLINLRTEVSHLAHVANEALLLAGDKRAAKMDTLANNVLSIARMEGIT